MIFLLRRGCHRSCPPGKSRRGKDCRHRYSHRKILSERPAKASGSGLRCVLSSQNRPLRRGHYRICKITLQLMVEPKRQSGRRDGVKIPSLLPDCLFHFGKRRKSPNMNASHKFYYLSRPPYINTACKTPPAMVLALSEIVVQLPCWETLGSISAILKPSGIFRPPRRRPRKHHLLWHIPAYQQPRR